MRRLLGDPQRLAHVQYVRSRHIGNLAPHPFKVCNAPRCGHTAEWPAALYLSSLDYQSFGCWRASSTA